MKKTPAAAAKETAILIRCEVVTNPLRNEPAAKIATAEPAAARGRLGRDGKRQKDARYEADSEEMPFHTIDRPSISPTILAMIAKFLKVATQFQVVNVADTASARRKWGLDVSNPWLELAKRA